MSFTIEQEREVIQDVLKRAKGWPVGIPIEKEMAYNLVEKEYAEWAPTAYVYPTAVWAVRITTKGKYL